MFSSKFFSLLTFAAAAVAQEIPVGPFFIADFESKLVLEAGFMGSDPNLESFIFLSERNESNNAQMWSTDGYGTLTNEASKRVLEVHTTNDVIIHGTKLQLAYKNETGHLGNQAWAYNPVSRFLFSQVDERACILVKSSAQYAVVDYCYSPDYDYQRWDFI